MTAPDAVSKAPYQKIGGFCFMQKSIINVTYDKPFKKNDELIELLESRNVIITDKEFAKKCISDISYYSLINGYKNLFPYDQDNKFKIPIEFYEFYNLYRFDTMINNVMFKYIIAIEKSLKSKLSYIISEKYGVFTDLGDYTNNNPDDYLCRKHYRNNNQTQSILKKIKTEISKTKNESVNHYKENHNHIPCWILVNGIPFGLTIKWYEILKPSEKDIICNQFISTTEITIQDKKEFFKKSLDILRKYRNNIAHGNKIFNNTISEELPKKSVLLLSNNLITKIDYKHGIGRNDIFAVIIIICMFIDEVSKNIFLNEVINIFSLFDTVTFSQDKSLLQMLKLPTDFLERLKKLLN